MRITMTNDNGRGMHIDIDPDRPVTFQCDHTGIGPATTWQIDQHGERLLREQLVQRAVSERGDDTSDRHAGACGFTWRTDDDRHHVCYLIAVPEGRHAHVCSCGTPLPAGL